MAGYNEGWGKSPKLMRTHGMTVLLATAVPLDFPVEHWFRERWPKPPVVGEGRLPYFP